MQKRRVVPLIILLLHGPNLLYALSAEERTQAIPRHFPHPDELHLAVLQIEQPIEMDVAK